MIITQALPSTVGTCRAGNVRNHADIGSLTPTVSQRRVKSSIAVASGQTVLLAGLISERNDKARTGHRPEASRVVPWFNEAYQGPAVSTCKGRWVAIRKSNRVAYAQWEDAGPFRTDHWQYVFGNDRPKPNLNKGAGLDVSPAVRDYLGLKQTDVSDWRFVDFSEVPRGPWSTSGENNTFVINSRKKDVKVTERSRRNEIGVLAR